MPLYDYQCAQCKEITEVRHGFDQTHSDPCPKCAGQLMRLFNPAGIVFKGSGFYVNDSRKASAPKTESADSNSAGASSAAGSAPDSKAAAPSTPSKESAA